MRSLLGSETKNYKKLQFTHGMLDIHKKKLKGLKKRANNKHISIDLGGKLSKLIYYGQQ